MQRVISAPATYSINGLSYTFTGWSDGGSATHTIATPSSNTTYTANYALITFVQFERSYFAATENSGSATILFKRIGNLSNALTVSFTVADGTAKAGVDYVASNGTATFAAGSATATANLQVLNDALLEPKETANFALVAGPGFTLGAVTSATLSILDDDSRATDIMGRVDSSGEWWVAHYDGTTSYLLCLLQSVHALPMLFYCKRPIQ